MYTNAEMEGMVSALAPLLGRRDVIGYAAARNTRLLEQELTEYRARRDELVREHGEPELGDDGEPTGVVGIGPSSPGWGAFAAEVAPLAEIGHEPPLMRVGYGLAVGELTGAEILSVDWMFEDEGEDE